MVYNYQLKGEGAQRAIYSAIEDICISMKAEDFLDMPDKVIIDERVEFTPKLAEDYKNFERDLVLSLFSDLGEKEISVANAAALSNKLLQFANGAVYDETRAVHEVHDLKLDKLEDIYEAANGRPLLVAVAFKHDATRILKRFKAVRPRVLDGQADIDDWNAGLVPILILHPASGGHGLNIQRGSNYVVWFGLNWSLELYKQLNARLWRQGQKAKQVFIYRILSAGTLDERVVRTLSEKDATEGELLDAVKPERALVEAVREIIKKYV